MATSSRRRNECPAASNTAEDGAGERAESDSVAKIVAACQQGDRDAQRRLYEACHQNIYRLMVRMVGEQAAADLTQQVFLQAFRRIGQFSGRARFETWLYRLAVNESLQYLRREKKRSQWHTLKHEPMDYSPAHDESTEHKDLLEQALQRLDPELRCVFLLREVEGLAYRDIAASLGLSEGTVGSQLNRARRRLREHLVELGWEA